MGRVTVERLSENINVCGPDPDKEGHIYQLLSCCCDKVLGSKATYERKSLFILMISAVRSYSQL